MGLLLWWWKGLLALLFAASLAAASTDDVADDDPDHHSSRTEAIAAAPRWSCIVPYYNEAATIGRCLESLAAQSRRPLVVLVDNGSTDGSRAVAEACCERLGLPFRSLVEPRPGKVAALAAGLASTDTPFVATCDADTWYPPDYLARANRLLSEDGIVAGAAFVVSDRDARLKALTQRTHRRLAALAAPWQCHSGGAGQVFRTDALRRVGGFSPERWNWVLEDHEILGRMSGVGRIAYDLDFWCNPLARPRRAAAVGWTLGERLCYHMTTRGSLPAYFESYLAPRLTMRGQANILLRRDSELA